MRTRKEYKFIHKISILSIFLAAIALAGCSQVAHSRDASSSSSVNSMTSNTKINHSLLNSMDVNDKEYVTVLNDLDENKFLRDATRVFIDNQNISSTEANREGLKKSFAFNALNVFDEKMDSRSVALTPNTESVYSLAWIEVIDEPMVLELPPGVLGLLDNSFFDYVADLGAIGPDKGKGGKYLLTPPDYKGEIPKGYFHLPLTTHGNWMLLRGFLKDGSPKPAADMIKATGKIYPLSKAGQDNPNNVTAVSGLKSTTVPASNYRFFEQVNAVIQREPVDTLPAYTLESLKSIGIEKGKPFNPAAREKVLLAEAAAMGNAIARALTFYPRGEQQYIYGMDNSWVTPFPGGSHEFVNENGVRMFDAKTIFFQNATGITPAMAVKMVGRGSQYGGIFLDKDFHALDGGKTYKMTLPANIPAEDFWSIVVYDSQTRSFLQSDQQFPSLNGETGTVKINNDGTTDIWFAPIAPEGHESNWIQTIPGKSWTSILRLYGPLEPWFDQTWRPGEAVWQKEFATVKSFKEKYAYQWDVPDELITPDNQSTSIGDLNYFDGVPKKETVELAYNNLDFIRALAF